MKRVKEKVGFEVTDPMDVMMQCSIAAALVIIA